VEVSTFLEGGEAVVEGISFLDPELAIALEVDTPCVVEAGSDEAESRAIRLEGR
jgi:hypothetical protein